MTITTIVLIILYCIMIIAMFAYCGVFLELNSTDVSFFRFFLSGIWPITLTGIIIYVIYKLFESIFEKLKVYIEERGKK